MNTLNKALFVDDTQNHQNDQKIYPDIESQLLKNKQNMPHRRKHKKTDFVKVLKALYPLACVSAKGFVGVAVLGTIWYGFQKVEQIQKQSHERSAVSRVSRLVSNYPMEEKMNICHSYDSVLAEEIQMYQNDGLSPYCAVRKAHVDMMERYKAFDPKLKTAFVETYGWVLLDHIAYRCIQSEKMNLSKKEGDKDNPFLEYLRKRENPEWEKEQVGTYDLFEVFKRYRSYTR